MTRWMKTGAALCLGTALTLAAAPASAKNMAWIHEVSASTQTVTLGPVGGTGGTVYRVTDQTQISGPDGPLTLSELPSMERGSTPDVTNVVYDAAEGSGGSVLYELHLMPRMDQ